MMATKSKKSLAVVLALTLLVAFAGLAVANTPAGTQISNQATATYKVGDKVRSSASNVVYVTVQQVAGVEVGPSGAQSRTVVAGQTVQHVYTVKNTGNGTDTFDLGGTLVGDFSGATVAWHHDKNDNGVINSGDPAVTEITLGAGEEVNIIAQFTVPASASEGDAGTLQLTAASKHDDDVSGQSDTVTYTVADADVVTAVLERDKGEVEPGESITYTVKVTNQTGSPISTTVVDLFEPDTTTFEPGSLEVQGVSQTDPGAWPAPVTISNLAAGQTAIVTYTVEVDGGAPAGYITNSVKVQAGTTGVEFATNEVRTLVKQDAGVAITKTDHPDDYTVDPAKVGHEYSFTYTVKNTGNDDDTIYVDTSGLPTDWPVQLYKSDGVTPLPKQDGKYTVGNLGSGDSTDIVVKVLVPVDVEDGAGPFDLDTTVTSKSDSSKEATETAKFENVDGAGVIVTVGEKPTPGKDVPNPGEIVEYPVKIKNDGPTEDTFDLIDEDFPKGTIVEFFDKDGNPITELPLEPGEEETIYVRITIPEDAKPDKEVNGKVVGESQNNPGTKDEGTIEIVVADYINFTVAPDRTGAVNQGSFAEYEFTITNDGNSEKTFSLEVKTPNKLAYQFVGGDSITVDKNESKTFNVRVDADYVVNVGWTESVQVIATTEDQDNNEVSGSATLTMTVIGSELSMVKSADVTEQEPGEDIVYTIEVTNISTGPVTDVVIYDAIPEHTQFVGLSDAGAEVKYSTDGGSTWEDTADAEDVTNVSWNVGGLAVNETVTVTLTVKVK